MVMRSEAITRPARSAARSSLPAAPAAPMMIWPVASALLQRRLGVTGPARIVRASLGSRREVRDAGRSISQLLLSSRNASTLAPPPSPATIARLRNLRRHCAVRARARPPPCGCVAAPASSIRSLPQARGCCAPPRACCAAPPPRRRPAAAPPHAGPSAVRRPMDEPTFTDAEVEAARDAGRRVGRGARALRAMQWRRDEAVKASSVAPSAEMASDLRLFRTLVATSFKAAEAAQMYTDTLAWRRTRDGRGARRARRRQREFFEGSGSTSRRRTSPTPTARDGATARLQGGGRRVRAARRQGGQPGVHRGAVGRRPRRGVLIKGEYVKAELRAQELLQLVIDEFSKRLGKMVLIFRIIDLTGFSPRPTSSRAAR